MDGLAVVNVYINNDDLQLHVLRDLRKECKDVCTIVWNRRFSWPLKSFMMHWLNMKAPLKEKKLTQTTHLSLPITLKDKGSPSIPDPRDHTTKLVNLKAPWTQLLIMGIDIKTAIRTTSSLNLIWCVNYDKPSHNVKHYYWIWAYLLKAS